MENKAILEKLMYKSKLMAPFFSVISQLAIIFASLLLCGGFIYFKNRWTT